MIMMMMMIRQKDFCTQQFLPAYQNTWRPQCVWWCQSHCCCSSLAQVLRRRKKKTHHPKPQICTRSGGIPRRLRSRRKRRNHPKRQFHSLLFSTFAFRLSDPIDSKDFGNAVLLPVLLLLFFSIFFFRSSRPSIASSSSSSSLWFFCFPTIIISQTCFPCLFDCQVGEKQPIHLFVLSFWKNSLFLLLLLGGSH